MVNEVFEETHILGGNVLSVHAAFIAHIQCYSTYEYVYSFYATLIIYVGRQDDEDNCGDYICVNSSYSTNQELGDEIGKKIGFIKHVCQS